MKDVYEWLNLNLSNVVELLQSKINSELKNNLTDMRMKELSDLMFSKPKDLSNEESQGRQSGSLAWRLSRQETTQGKTRQACVNTQLSGIFSKQT